MHSVKLILTDAQLKKMKSSNPFQLSHRQLSGNSKGKHEIMLNLPETETQKLVSNIQQGKGFRFNPKKFVRQAKNTLKQVGKTAKKAGKFIVDNVPKEITKDVANLVADELELGEQQKDLVNKGIDLGYKSQGKGISRRPNPWINHVKNFAKQYGLSYRDALKHPQVKTTYQKGGSFLGDLKKGFKRVGKVLKPAAPIVKEVGKEVAKDAVKGAILGVGHKSKQNIHNEGGNLLRGIPKTLASRKRAQEHIKTNGLMHGGSFLPLGGD